MSSDTIRSKLECYCYVHQPQNIAKVDAILTAYRGREAEMMAALREKYGPQPSETDAYRARLQRFFAHYNPEKLSSIDEILRVYEGARRSQLFPALEAKYGPESEALLTARGGTKPAPSVSASTPEASRASFGNDTRSRLARFMEKYNREKLGSIDTILTAYAGRETELFAALVKKYGPEPLAAGEESPAREAPRAPPPAAAAEPPEAVKDTRSRLIRFMEKYNRDKLGSIDTILTAYAGRETEMFAALVKKYGPEPGSEGSVASAATDPVADFLQARKLTALQVLEDFPHHDVITSLSKAFGAPNRDLQQTRARLERFFQQYNREKLASLDTVLNAYAGRETELFEALVKKYGPEPPMPASSAPTSVSASSVKEFLSSRGIGSAAALEAIFPTKQALVDYLKTRYGDHAGRLRRLFVRYAPELLPSAESLLQESANAEEQLLAKYVRQLGPEPPADAPDRIVTLFSRRVDRGNTRFDDMDAVDEGESGAGDAAKTSSLEPPSVVKEGYVLMKDSDKAPPGDYSGDESKAFPGDEEQWLQLVIGDLSALDASSSAADLRRRTYSEFAGEMSDGEASPTSPRLHEDEEEASASPARTSPRPASTTTFGVRVKSKLGLDVADLCSDCSKQLAHAFDALWQPVGPGHRKALSSSTTKEGFLEKLSGARMGAKWQRRYFRVNDKGIHYFETNQASEKPKGYKVLTRRSVLRPVVDPKTNPKCSDPNFAYFSVTCNETNEDFLLRADSAEERASWVEFLKAALERAKLSVVGQDPIPARWRARVSGLKLSTSELILQANESFAEAKRLNSLRDALRVELEEERAQLEVMEARRHEVAKQRDHLAKSLTELGEMVAAAEHDAELNCLNLAEAAAETALKREALDSELRTARQRVQETTSEMVGIEKEVVVLEHERDREQLRLHQVFQRWRNVEQRQKSPLSLR